MDTVLGMVLDGLAGALGGGVIGALMTSRAERKRSQTEIALRFIEQFMAQYDQLAAVMGFLQDLASLADVENMNKVRAFGDWCEIVSASCLADLADVTLLNRVGIPDQMRDFHEKAKRVIPLQDTVKLWTNLNEFLRQENR